MYVCPECYQPVKVRPGAPEGRCARDLKAAKLRTALTRAERLGLEDEARAIRAELRRMGLIRPDREENRKTGASRHEGSTPSRSTSKNTKGGALWHTSSTPGRIRRSGRTDAPTARGGSVGSPRRRGSDGR